MLTWGKSPSFDLSQVAIESDRLSFTEMIPFCHLRYTRFVTRMPFWGIESRRSNWQKLSRRGEHNGIRNDFMLRNVKMELRKVIAYNCGQSCAIGFWDGLFKRSKLPMELKSDICHAFAGCESTHDRLSKQ
eukprot:3342433-Amphidinium_carterae.1